MNEFGASSVLPTAGFLSLLCIIAIIHCPKTCSGLWTTTTLKGTVDKATKGEKSLHQSDMYDEIGEDMFSGQTITGNLLEQNGQTETVIYTTFPSGDQIQQFHMV